MVCTPKRRIVTASADVTERIAVNGGPVTFFWPKGVGDVLLAI
jgi:hypothetical protein